jgi:hypothetical protein
MVQTSADRAGGVDVDRSRRVGRQVRTSRGGVMFDGWFRLTTVAALALAVHAVGATASLAQQWPTHPVRFVLPFGPGSGADTAASLVTDTLAQKWGQPIVVGGKPGGDRFARTYRRRFSWIRFGPGDAELFAVFGPW